MLNEELNVKSKALIMQQNDLCQYYIIIRLLDYYYYQCIKCMLHFNVVALQVPV